MRGDVPVARLVAKYGAMMVSKCASPKSAKTEACVKVRCVFLHRVKAVRTPCGATLLSQKVPDEAVPEYKTTAEQCGQCWVEVVKAK